MPSLVGVPPTFIIHSTIVVSWPRPPYALMAGGLKEESYIILRMSNIITSITTMRDSPRKNTPQSQNRLVLAYSTSARSISLKKSSSRVKGMGSILAALAGRPIPRPNSAITPLLRYSDMRDAFAYSRSSRFFSAGLSFSLSCMNHLA